MVSNSSATACARRACISCFFGLDLLLGDSSHGLKFFRHRLRAPRLHLLFFGLDLLLGLVALLLVFCSSFGLELLDVLEVLLHVRQNFFFFNNTSYFLLLLALDRFHALPLDLDGGGFLFCGFIQRSFLARTQTSGPLVPLRLLHQVVSATFHERNFILSTF